MRLNEYRAQRATEGRGTQAELAKEIGISRSYLAEILSGAKKPGRDTIEKIERATDGRVPASVWFPPHRSGEAAA